MYVKENIILHCLRIFGTPPADRAADQTADQTADRAADQTADRAADSKSDLYI